MPRSLTVYAEKNIKEIHRLSRRYNGKKKEHAKVLLELLKKHVNEIEELYWDGNPHFAVEAGDLLILCHELLLEKRKDPNEIMTLCYGRYKKKLNELIDKHGKRKSK